MSDIDETSLAWIGYSAICRFFLMNEGQMITTWSPNLDAAWSLAAEAIACEAIRRYEADKKRLHEVAPKPRYGGFLEAARDLSR